MPYVLLVDDDADCRYPLARTLERAGYEVNCVPDGRAAIHSILQRMPDVVILDLCMPAMDGARLLEVIRSYVRLQSIHVIVLTAAPDSDLADEARSLGVARVLTKGLSTFAEIHAAIEGELTTVPPPGDSSGAHLSA